MNLTERTDYSNKVNKLTLKELRQELSNVNSELAHNCGEGIVDPELTEKLAVLAFPLNNFFIFAKIDENKTFRELKNE